MNRIVLIGNGFDLAHGLKTSYKNFIDDYWANFLTNAQDNKQTKFTDDCFSFSTDFETLAHIISSDKMPVSFSELQEQIKTYKLSNVLRLRSTVNLETKSKFMYRIINRLGLHNWVDVENEYYKNLKEIATAIISPFDKYNIDSLNMEFDIIQRLLEDYLTKEEQKCIIESSIIKEINKKILSPFSYRDIAFSKAISFANEIKEKITYFEESSDKDLKVSYYKRRYPDIDIDCRDIEHFIKDYNKSDNKDIYLTKHIIRDTVPSYFMLPDDIIYINFNYTHTTNNYNVRDFEAIHIHGELNNKDNPIIFGYGDELAESYRGIENLNDNRYLKNIKSIRYNNTSNYRKIINFAESSSYQILTMGHSCGNSDRTLLNTLFEHKNCNSIKTYYHQINDSIDNYTDIIQNISRNFKDKILMRELVVNKEYSEPLLAYKER